MLNRLVAKLIFAHSRPALGGAGMHLFIGIRNKSDVIVCANDDMAIGAWMELSRRGISIPDEIAVTGFDNRLICTLIPFCATYYWREPVDKAH